MRGVLFTCALLGMVVVGALAARRRWVSAVPLRTLAVCWAVGYLAAVLGWAAPGAVGWVAANVPGGGLLRDGSRLLALAVPLTASLCAAGTDRLIAWLPDAFSRVVVAAGVALMPVALMPDAGLAASGRLDPVDYPSSYEELRARLDRAPPGDLVLLPFESYRAPSWNDDYRPVLAPLGRYAGRTVVTDDRLVVDGDVVPGEDPRAAQVRQALEQTSPERRADGLRAAGVRLVLSEELEGHPVPPVEGRRLWRGDAIALTELTGEVSGEDPPVGWRISMAAAWGSWAALLPVMIWQARRRRPIRGGDRFSQDATDSQTG